MSDKSITPINEGQILGSDCEPIAFGNNPMKQQIEELIKEAEERIAERTELMNTSDTFDLFLINSSHILEAEHFLSRLKEIAQTPTSNCDFRKKECVNDGQMIDGVWRCNNHLQRR